MTVLEVGLWLASIVVLFICVAIIVAVQGHNEVECVRAGGKPESGHCASADAP